MDALSLILWIVDRLERDYQRSVVSRDVYRRILELRLNRSLPSEIAGLLSPITDENQLYWYIQTLHDRRLLRTIQNMPWYEVTSLGHERLEKLRDAELHSQLDDIIGLAVRA